MVWGVSAALHTEPGSALSAEEEFRPPVAVSSGAADGVDGPEAWDPPLPRRRQVAVFAAGARRAVTLADSSGEAQQPGAAGRPDLNVLAQVLRGLQRMA